jgi:hypothetical protein
MPRAADRRSGHHRSSGTSAADWQRRNSRPRRPPNRIQRLTGGGEVHGLGQSLGLPGIGAPTRLEDARPHRFDQFAGFVFTALALISFAPGVDVASLGLTAITCGVATLNASTGVCRGCMSDLLIRRLRPAEALVDSRSRGLIPGAGATAHRSARSAAVSASGLPNQGDRVSSEAPNPRPSRTVHSPAQTWFDRAHRCEPQNRTQVQRDHRVLIGTGERSIRGGRLRLRADWQRWIEIRPGIETARPSTGGQGFGPLSSTNSPTGRDSSGTYEVREGGAIHGDLDA